MIKVLFFASLREQLQADGVDILPAPAMTLEGVRQYLQATYPDWRNALDNERLLMAVNQTLAKGNATVKDGDEVAIFPPVTGG